MNTHQQTGSNQAQRLQNALGLFKPPTGGVGGPRRGIGVVDPDDDNSEGGIHQAGRGDGAHVPRPAPVPCQTGIDLSANERISEGAELNPSIHRIKYNKTYATKVHSR